MIITPDFVFLNNPRTGTTFCRKVFKQAYQHYQNDVFFELILPKKRGRGSGGQDHHGTRSQIPKQYENLPVWGGVRNPFTLLVSIYELGLWDASRTSREANSGASPRRSSSFEQFLHWQQIQANYRWGLESQTRGFGPLTLHHIQMFSSTPGHSFDLIRNGASDTAIEASLMSIGYVRQENLRDDLGSLLQSVPHKIEMEAALSIPASHVTKRGQLWNRATFSDQLVDRILRHEAFLFRTLSRYGYQYTIDNADFRQAN